MTCRENRTVFSSLQFNSIPRYNFLFLYTYIGYVYGSTTTHGESSQSIWKNESKICNKIF